MTSIVRSISRQDKSPRDGNDRVARIARWLARSPGPTAVALQLLITTGDETDLAQIWDRDFVEQSGEAMAWTIDELIRSTAEEHKIQIRARLQWVTADNPPQPLTSQTYVCNPDASDIRAELDGGGRSQAKQAQTHLEAMTRLLLPEVGTLLDRADRQTERAYSLLDRRDKERDDAIARVALLEAENAQLRSLMEQAIAAAEEVRAKGTAGGSTRFDKYIEVLGPLLQAKLMGGLVFPSNDNGRRPPPPPPAGPPPEDAQTEEPTA
jgi:hypothetical protein